MKNIKELLQIVRNNIDKYFNDYSNGLCLIIDDLKWDKIITKEEELCLLDFIHRTMPIHPEWKNNIHKCGYGWEPGELQPRLDYLDEYLSKSLEKLEEILK